MEGVFVLNFTDPKQQELFRQIIREEATAAFRKFKKEEDFEKTFTIEQTRKILGYGYTRTKKLIDDGILKVARNNKVTYTSIQEYLKEQGDE